MKDKLSFMRALKCGSWRVVRALTDERQIVYAAKNLASVIFQSLLHLGFLVGTLKGSICMNMCVGGGDSVLDDK